MDQWSNHDVATLRRMWADKRTMSDIGDAVGRDRSAVGGKIRRLGLTRRGPSAAEVPAHRYGLRLWRPPPKTRQPRAARREAGGVPLMDLSADGCRWPVGEDARGSYLFCDAAVLKGSSYCPGHAKMSHPSHRTRELACR